LFRDSGQTRKLIFDNVLAAANKIEPVSNPRHTLSVENARWSGPADYSLAEQKQAVLSRGTLGRRLVGDLILRDTTGTELARRSTQLARVPYMTDRGTFIQGGNEYTMAHQMRLKPGVFTRRKQNGELESHVNVSRGFSHRIFMDPATGVFRVAIGQAKMPGATSSFRRTCAMPTPRQLENSTASCTRTVSLLTSNKDRLSLLKLRCDLCHMNRRSIRT
jgi:hypothetical protein